MILEITKNKFEFNKYNKLKCFKKLYIIFILNKF
jgi:hypothetical protein